jgi:hypothetical protein
VLLQLLVRVVDAQLLELHALTFTHTMPWTVRTHAQQRNKACD